MSTDLAQNVPNSEAVLTEITRILQDLLGEYGLDDIEVTRETLFQDDLELESIDLVALGGKLRESYGEAINFAEFLGSMELDEIIEMRVGQLVEYVVERLSNFENASASEGAA